MLEDSSERAVNVIDYVNVIVYVNVIDYVNVIEYVNVIDYVNVIVMLSIQLLCLKENDTDTQRDVSCRCAAKP